MCCKTCRACTYLLVDECTVLLLQVLQCSPQASRLALHLRLLPLVCCHHPLCTAAQPLRCSTMHLKAKGQIKGLIGCSAYPNEANTPGISSRAPTYFWNLRGLIKAMHRAEQNCIQKDI